MYRYRWSSFARIYPFDIRCLKLLVYVKINVGIAASLNGNVQLFSIFNVSLVSDKIVILKFIKLMARNSRSSTWINFKGFFMVFTWFDNDMKNESDSSETNFWYYQWSGDKYTSVSISVFRRNFCRINNNYFWFHGLQQKKIRYKLKKDFQSRVNFYFHLTFWNAEGLNLVMSQRLFPALLTLYFSEIFL